jgi:hypothetical protein
MPNDGPLPESLEDEPDKGLYEYYAPKIKAAWELFKKDPKQFIKERHKDIFFGHMDNCTDIHDTNTKELEKCIEEAIRKDALARNPIGVIPNFISSQKEKKKMVEELEKTNP